jgi:hypothetical protein
VTGHASIIGYALRMRRILSCLPLIALMACITPAHAPTRPRGFPGLHGVMNHLPDGRWQFVLELPNPDRSRVYTVESFEPLDLRVEQDAPHSRAIWIADANRVASGQSFQLKLWSDGDDFPIQVQFPRGGKDYGPEGTASLIILAAMSRH